MVDSSSWHSCYETLPDGRCRMTAGQWADLEARDSRRIFETTLGNRRCKVFMLDRPFQLGPSEGDADSMKYYLNRIRLRELPGWPPRISRGSAEPRIPGALKCSLQSVEEIEAGPGNSESILFALDCNGIPYRAWLVGCPLPLLRAAVATLRQDGTIGKKLGDLQEMRLI